METKMGPLKAAMRRVAPPKDRSYRDPYRLVTDLAADRKAFGVGAAFILVVSVATFTGVEDIRFLPFATGVVLALALSFGVGAGMCFGLWKSGSLCHESLSSIRPLPPLDHEQLQSSQTGGASPTASEAAVHGQEPIAVAPNSTRSAT